MTLRGNFATLPLTDLLQLISQTTKSGTLLVELGTSARTIFFDGGLVVSAESTDPTERVGQFLISRGFCTEDELLQALQLQERKGLFLGEALVEIGALTKDSLERALLEKTEEIIYALFDWSADASFAFQPGQPDPERLRIPVQIDVGRIVWKGATRHDEMMRIREVFPDFNIVLQQTDKPLPEDVLKETPGVLKVLPMVDGKKSIAQLVLEAHSSEYAVGRDLLALQQAGCVEEAQVASAADTGQFLELVAAEMAKSSAAAAAPVEETGGGLDQEQVEEVTLEPSEDKVGTVSNEPEAEGPGPGEPVAAPSAAGSQPGKTVSKPPASSREEPEVLEGTYNGSGWSLKTSMDAAEPLLQEGRYDEALQLFRAELDLDPESRSMRTMVETTETLLIEDAYKNHLPPDAVLVRISDEAGLLKANLTPEEYYLLSRIDGQWDVKSVIKVSPLREVDAVAMLMRLVRRKIIKAQEAW